MTAKDKKKFHSSTAPDPATELEEKMQQEGEKDLGVELADAMRKLQESEERVLRIAADFENSRKRLERDREISLKYAEENILKDLLPGIDNIERAMDQGREAGNVESLLQGVELTRDGLLATLGKYGVKAIDAIGQPFDPNIHEALAMEETDGMEPNMVLREFQKGYFYRDRLLRPAKVIVSKPPGSGT